MKTGAYVLTIVLIVGTVAFTAWQASTTGNLARAIFGEQIQPGGENIRVYGGGKYCFKTILGSGQRLTEQMHCSTSEEEAEKRKESLRKKGIQVGPVFTRPDNV